MIDHISVSVSNLVASAAFYETVLEPLGYKRLVERERTIGFGKTYPEIWLNLREGFGPVPDDTGAHVCLRAASIEAIIAFYDLAVAHGGRGDGASGDRQGAMTSYFGAFIRDPDGNKIEAATFPNTENLT